MGGKKHTNKAIQAVIEKAMEQGWRLKEPGSSAHAWAFLYCPEESRIGCKISVWSTPRVPENHAKQLLKIIQKCEHKGGNDAKL
jgi:hypothetical protein